MKTKDKIDLRNIEKRLWREGYQNIAGVDEAGRGPLVGPVVAGAVILPKNYDLEGLNDSKQLSEKKRNLYYDIIMKDAIAVGIGIVDAKTIDEINIYEASRLAMKKALNDLNVTPDYILTDAMPISLDTPLEAIIHGDALSISIAAGSVIAKVTRDRLMEELDKKHPEYEFKNHKGYPTKRHLELLSKYGPLENYRFTYKPVRALMDKEIKKEEV
ncbi:MAG: ribonuclease HII [Bacilli bacterium]|nr:ribonuclease HII [Bacilli bacterium]